MSANINFIRNGLTYFFEYAFTTGINFALAIIVARHYGSATFGQYSLIQSITQLSLPLLATSGEMITIRELVRRNNPHDLTMGSSFCFFLASTLLAASLLYINIWIFYPEGREIGAGFVTALLFSPFTVIEHFFKSEGTPRRTLAAKALALSLGFTVKNAAMLLGAPIATIAFATIGETALTAIGLLWFYRRAGYSPVEWIFDWRIFVDLSRFFFPSIVSGFVISTFFRITHMMVNSLSTHTELGLYSLSFQVVQAFTLFPQILMSTFYPSLVEAQKRDNEVYTSLSRLIFSTFSLASLSIVLAMYLFGSSLFEFIAGQKYAGISSVLNVLCIALIFNFSAAARSQVLFVENAQIYHMFNAAIGLIFLVPANLILIPRFGALGAASAVATASAVSGVLTSFAFKRSWTIGNEQIRALMIYPAISNLWDHRSLLRRQS